MRGGLLLLLLLAVIIILLIYTGQFSSKEKSPVTMLKKIDSAKIISLNSQITTIKNALNQYYYENNEYPEILDVLIPLYIRHKEGIIDPWGTKIKLESDDSMNLILISAGKDKTFGSTDDIKRRI